MSLKYELRRFESESIGDYGVRVAAIRNWCSENIHRPRGGQWDLLDINMQSIRGGGSVFDIVYIEFADPEVASLVALKFGL
jgi:hypothetical protein